MTDAQSRDSPISRVAQMAAAARDPIVVLHKYNKLRSKKPQQLVLVFEGVDDPIFYSVIAKRCGFTQQYLVLIADGKDILLGFRKLLMESVEARKGEGVAFFIDHDFDGLKGAPPGSDLYCTPTYAIENIAVAPKVVSTLLSNEFKLHDPDELDDTERLTSKYKEVVNEFATKIRDVNLLIYVGRTLTPGVIKSRLIEIDDTPKRIFTLDSDTLQIACHCTGESAIKIAKFSPPITIEEAQIALTEFNKLEPHTQWRGKFWLALLQKFLSILQEDRNSAEPKHFTKGKGKVRLNIATDSPFRILASACDIPDCMRSFFENLPQNALH
jgi:hypothetical protein